MLRARMAAAVGKPDAEVLGLLQEAGQTDWGKRQVPDANKQPELTAFFVRMNGDEHFRRMSISRRKLSVSSVPSSTSTTLMATSVPVSRFLPRKTVPYDPSPTLPHRL